MNNKKRYHTKQSVNWYLEVGYRYGTMTESKARLLAGRFKKLAMEYINVMQYGHLKMEATQ